MKLVPMFDRIKVLPDKSESITKSGIVIPDKALRAEKKATGVIVDMGDSCESDLKVDDHILFGEYAGFFRYEDADGLEVSESQGTKYQYMSELDVVARFI